MFNSVAALSTCYSEQHARQGLKLTSNVFLERKYESYLFVPPPLPKTSSAQHGAKGEHNFIRVTAAILIHSFIHACILTWLLHV